MTTYDALREFADSWMLAGFTVMFIYIVVRVLRPGKQKLYRELARMPLDDKDEV